jgi:hypothetical protein
VKDLQLWEEAELDRLARYREGAGDRGLGSDDRRSGREDQQRVPAPAGRHEEERILGGAGVVQDHRRLPEVVEHQRRECQGEPSEPHRGRSEVAPVGVEGLGSGDSQHDAAEDEVPPDAVVEQEPDPPSGRQPLEHRGLLDDLVEADHTDRDEPDDDHGTEQRADRSRPGALDHEQPDEDADGARDHEMAESRLGDLEALDGTEHRDRAPA